jgi:hypothetical protein
MGNCSEIMTATLPRLDGSRVAGNATVVSHSQALQVTFRLGTIQHHFVCDKCRVVFHLR